MSVSVKRMPSTEVQQPKAKTILTTQMVQYEHLNNVSLKRFTFSHRPHRTLPQDIRNIDHFSHTGIFSNRNGYNFLLFFFEDEHKNWRIDRAANYRAVRAIKGNNKESVDSPMPLKASGKTKKTPPCLSQRSHAE